jgi:glycosyltransferase involved in cell wall biosynthesis
VFELTVLMPCLNEAQTLSVCIRKAQASLRELNVRGEVLIADNGSTDGSQPIARSEGARVVDVAERGYGAALRSGIEAARGCYVLMADADDSYALDDFGAFLSALRAGADLVMGNRFKGGIAPGAMPFLHRWLGNPVLSRVGQVFFHIPIGDFHCGMRAFRRDRIRTLGLQTDGMEFASEMVVRASLSQLKITEVPTTLRPDGRSRAAHLRTWHDGWRHLRFLLAFSPRWLLRYPAITMLAVGTIGLVWLWFGPISVAGIEFSLQTMLAFATMVIVGLQALGLSVVSRVYAAHLGMLPPSRRIQQTLERLTLERGLFTGIVLTLAGIAAYATTFAIWGSKKFGQLDVIHTMRGPIIGTVLIVAGGQLIMVSFTISLGRFSAKR